MVVAFFASLGVLAMVVLTVLQIHSYRRLRRQTALMRVQGREIENQLRELKQQSSQMAQLNEEKIRITSVVSHDLKGPFNRIFALGQLLLLSGDNFTREQKDYLSMIHQIVADGMNMLRNLLDYRRLEEKGIHLNPEPINVIAVVNTLVKNYGVIADKKNIHIHFENSDPLTLITDKTCLSRITDNLLSNAIKFSPPETEVYVSARQREGSIEISIRDEGPGLSAHDQGKLFQKYQRLAPQPTGGESSTGLGLYLAHAMANKAQGDIRCESETGRGSTFIVSLRALGV